MTYFESEEKNLENTDISGSINSSSLTNENGSASKRRNYMRRKSNSEGTLNISSYKDSKKVEYSQTVLGKDKESMIVSWILEQYNNGTTVSPMNVRVKATDYAREREPNRPIFSKGWFKNFKQRHPEIQNKVKHSFEQRKRVLDDSEEEKLVEWVREKNKLDEFPSRRELITKATEIAKIRDPHRIPFSGGWALKFQRRHPSVKLNINHYAKDFTEEEENEIVKWIEEQNKVGKIPTGMEVRKQASVLAVKKELSKKNFGNDWYLGFSLRHPEMQLKTRESKRGKKRRFSEDSRIGFSQEDLGLESIEGNKMSGELSSQDERPKEKISEFLENNGESFFADEDYEDEEIEDGEDESEEEEEEELSDMVQSSQENKPKKQKMN